MEDFSNELFSSFFDDHLVERPQLGERTSFLHMDIESSPGMLLFYITSIRDVVLFQLFLHFTDYAKITGFYKLWCRKCHMHLDKRAENFFTYDIKRMKMLNLN